MHCSLRGAVPALLAPGLVFMLCAARPCAAAPGVGGGFDVYAGPGGEHAATALGFMSASGRRSSLALGGLRFDDNLVGAGLGVMGLIGAPLGRSATLRVAGTRFIGDGTFRAWRLKAGPEFALRGDRTLALSWLHEENNIVGTSNGAIAELGVPLAAGLTGRVSGSMAALAEDVSAMQGTFGILWTPRARLEIDAEAGFARNGAVTGAPVTTGARHGGPLGLPLLGDSGPSEQRTTSSPGGGRTEGVITLGVRGFFP